MRRKFARSSPLERVAIASLILAACASEQAEVGSDPPRDAGPSMSDGAPPAGEASTGSEAGSGRCDALAPLRLYYWNLRTAATSTDVNYIVKVENATGAPIALSSLEIRYYLTNELPTGSTIDVFYTDTCCSNKQTDFKDSIVTAVRSFGAKPSADAYLQIAFAPAVGALAAGDAVQVEIGFHDAGYVRSSTQTNDYSFSAAAGGTQAQWNDCPGAQCETKFTSCAMTVHKDGVLVWGALP